MVTSLASRKIRFTSCFLLMAQGTVNKSVSMHKRNFFVSQTRPHLQRHSVWLVWRLDREIYSLKVFYFLLYWCPYFLFVSELINYGCYRRPEILLRSQAKRLYKYTKIQGPWFQRNYIIARVKKSDLHGTSFQSLLKINHMFIPRLIYIQWKFTTPDHHSFVN